MRRHTAAGSSRITTASARSRPGTQTTSRRRARPSATASATCSGVEDNGAGDRPLVGRHPPDHEARAHQRQVHPGAAQRVGEAGREAVQAGLGRAVDVVGAPDPPAGDGGEHDDLPAAALAHAGRDAGEHADLGGVVGVHDGERVLGVDLRPLLVAEDPERDDDGVRRAVLPLDRVERPRRARRRRRRRTPPSRPRRSPPRRWRGSRRRGRRRAGPRGRRSTPGRRRRAAGRGRRRSRCGRRGRGRCRTRRGASQRGDAGVRQGLA